MTYDIYNSAGDLVNRLSEVGVQSVYKLDKTELDWCIEEAGVATVDEGGEEFHIVTHGDPLPQGLVS